MVYLSSAGIGMSKLQQNRLKKAVFYFYNLQCWYEMVVHTCPVK